MKINKFLVCVLILLSFASVSYTQGFNDIYSKDGIGVIAVGNNGSVFISYDGGANFGSYPQGSNTLNSVHALNSKVWIVGNSGTVIISTNGGTTFSAYSYTAGSLNGVHFWDDNTGWLVGNSGTIAKSTNGGINWTAQTSPAAVNLTDVKFTSAAIGYACGDNGTVIYTTNGGTNWLQYTTGTTKNLYSLDIIASTLIAGAADGQLLKLNGTTWSSIDYKIVTKTDVRGVAMISATTFYTCGGGGFINKSTDAGVTRIYQANPMVAPLKRIFFYDANKGWAVSSANNAVLRTTNGGTNWSFQSGVSVNYSFTLKQSTSGNIGDPFCLHPQNKNGVFILAGTSLYRSLDKGETWTLLQSGIPGSSCHSFFVNANDTNLMIAAKGSGGGRIIRSTDYGTTWTDVIASINLTSYGMPMEVDPNNPNRVYLAPDNAPMRVSNDWGANWTTLSGGEPGGFFRSPCDIIVGYENPNTIIVGDGTTGSGSGKVWKSTNAGLNWTLINTVSGSEIPMLANSSLDLNAAYHTTWSSGSFWKSTDLGTSFINLNQSGSLWAADIAKDDPNAVTFDVYGSNCWISVDGGASFTSPINVGSSPAAGVEWMDKATLLYQHGGGIHKLNVTYTVNPVLANNNNSTELPKAFSLEQNFPNPFNPSTVISYNVSEPSLISIKVYDVTGEEVETLVNTNMQPGKYRVNFDASNLAGGVYFYTLLASGSRVDTRKMVLIR